jgi:hypothetical protein
MKYIDVRFVIDTVICISLMLTGLAGFVYLVAGGSELGRILT